MKEDTAYQASGAGQQTVESAGGASAGGVTGTERSRASSPAPEAVEGRAKKAQPAGLAFPRFFTEAGVDPFDEVEWERRDAVIGNERGEVVFEQRDVEIPKSWSQQATNIVVSKYFRGQMDDALDAIQRPFQVSPAVHVSVQQIDARRSVESGVGAMNLGGEIIQQAHLVARLKRKSREVPADKARAAGDQYVSHWSRINQSYWGQ